MSVRSRYLWVVVFAVTFGWVEASVVIYLRELYYPGGFEFPLKPFPVPQLRIELIREFCTLVMLAAVGALAGTTRWQRFAWFSVAFGVWDLFFYGWLKAAIGWPATVTDWDILFLLPVPWIGPVIAPMLVSALLIIAGALIIREERVRTYRPGPLAWALAMVGCAIILWSFTSDTPATLRGALPARYHYELLTVGLACSSAALWSSLRRS